MDKLNPPRHAMHCIAKILQQQSVVIVDGGLGTELEKRGCDLNTPLWSSRLLLSEPETIAAVHTAYLEAGADCLITASYQASYEGFMPLGLSEKQTTKLLISSVSLACRARDVFWENTDQKSRPRPLVAASIGPYGAFLADGSEYRGNYGITTAALQSFHRKRMRTLIEAGPDLLACETIPCLAEAEVLADLLQEFPQVCCWMSFTARDAEHISSGEGLGQCVEYLEKYPQIAAIGINCTAPRHVEPLLAILRTKTDKPIIVYPNKGGHYGPTATTRIRDDKEISYKERSRLWFQQGARLIGGCCNTTPEDIWQIAEWVRCK